MSDDEQFMRQAIKLAEKAKKTGNLPFGALIVFDGKILAGGQSLELTNHDMTAHAEIIAITKASRILKSMDLSKCVLYTSGEPCIMCVSAIVRVGIYKIIYGARRKDMPKFIRERKIGILHATKKYQYKPQITTQRLRKEAIKLFDGVSSLEYK